MVDKNDEESFSKEYQYAWTSTSQISIEDFLSKYKPSMVENDGTKPWLWIRTEDAPGKGIPSSELQEKVLEEGARLLSEATDKIEGIKNDASIPARSSKKTGAKGKKEVREEAQAQYTEKLKEISQKYGYVHGKWLVFAPPDKVDIIWARLAKSIHSGPLSSTPIRTAKVATSPANPSGFYQHVICLYIPDVYDKDAVKSCMEILLRRHGCNLSGVKSDLYTLIGLDSKHPSGIQSTIWRNNDIMKESDIKALKDAFFAEQGNAQNETANGKEKEKAKDKSAKTKLSTNDPFASDDEGVEKNGKTEEAVKPKSKGKGKSAVTMPLKKLVDDPFGDDDDDDEEEEEEKPVKAAKTAKPPSKVVKPSNKEEAKGKEKRARKEVDGDSSDSEEDKKRAKLKAKRKGF